MSKNTKRKLLAEQLNGLWGQWIHRAWRGQCAIFRDNCDPRTLQAAHILSKGAFNHWRWEAWNGILLRHDMHEQYDKNDLQVITVLIRRYPKLFALADEHRKKHPDPWTLQELEDKVKVFKEALK